MACITAHLDQQRSMSESPSDAVQFPRSLEEDGADSSDRRQPAAAAAQTKQKPGRKKKTPDANVNGPASETKPATAAAEAKKKSARTKKMPDADVTDDQLSETKKRPGRKKKTQDPDVSDLVTETKEQNATDAVKKRLGCNRKMPDSTVTGQASDEMKDEVTLTETKKRPNRKQKTPDAEPVIGQPQDKMASENFAGMSAEEVTDLTKLESNGDVDDADDSRPHHLPTVPRRTRGGTVETPQVVGSRKKSAMSTEVLPSPTGPNASDPVTVTKQKHATHAAKKRLGCNKKIPDSTVTGPVSDEAKEEVALTETTKRPNRKKKTPDPESIIGQPSDEMASENSAGMSAEEEVTDLTKLESNGDIDDADDPRPHHLPTVPRRARGGTVKTPQVVGSRKKSAVSTEVLPSPTDGADDEEAQPREIEALMQTSRKGRGGAPSSSAGRGRGNSTTVQPADVNITESNRRGSARRESLLSVSAVDALNGELRSRLKAITPRRDVSKSEELKTLCRAIKDELNRQHRNCFRWDILPSGSYYEKTQIVTVDGEIDFDYVLKCSPSFDIRPVYAGDEEFPVDSSIVCSRMFCALLVEPADRDRSLPPDEFCHRSTDGRLWLIPTALKSYVEDCISRLHLEGRDVIHCTRYAEFQQSLLRTMEILDKKPASPAVTVKLTSGQTTYWIDFVPAIQLLGWANVALDWDSSWLPTEVVQLIKTGNEIPGVRSTGSPRRVIRSVSYDATPARSATTTMRSMRLCQSVIEEASMPPSAADDYFLPDAPQSHFNGEHVVPGSNRNRREGMGPYQQEPGSTDEDGDESNGKEVEDDDDEDQLTAGGSEEESADERSRVSTPSRNGNRKLRQYFPAVVTKLHPTEYNLPPEECCLWRLSFSAAEKMVMLKATTGSDRSCCKNVLKLLKQDLKEIKSNNHDMSFCSFYLKNIVLGLTEKMDGKSWNGASLRDRYVDALRETVDSLTGEHVGHYFIRGENIMALKEISRGEKKTLVELFEQRIAKFSGCC